MAGDEIIVAPGIYREYVNPRNAGREDARITYRSEVPLGAVITGAEVVTDWKKYDGTTYVTRVDNSVFGAYNPYIQEVEGDWYFANNHIHTGNVFVNDRMFYETQSLEECLAGEVYAPSWEPEYSVYKWFCEQDRDADETVIYANFKDMDPAAQKVEITVRRNCFLPSEKYISYITLSGFTVCKAATTWAPPAAYQDGMIGAHWSKGWIIEDCDISGSKCCGISFGNYSQENNDNYFFYKHVKSPTQMERDAVCRAQYDGWTKETVGGHIVRRCNIHHCSMGIWCDWQAQGTRITHNLMHDNMPPKGMKIRPDNFDQDIFVEVGHGPMLIDNNVLLSAVSLRIPTEGVAMVHNLICGSFAMVGSGVDSIVNGQREPRYTPYHIAHRTEVLGFMTILHGDDRFYNNIFVQRFKIAPDYLEGWNPEREPNNLEVGTHVWDEYPIYEDWIKQFDLEEHRPNMGKLALAHFGHLPVWVHGNAYLDGAQSFAREEDKLVSDAPVKIELIEENGHYRLETNMYDLLGDFKVHMIHTSTLGKAFEPEEQYENTDGTPITFDEDYLYNKRGLNVIPGPFASAEDAKKWLM